MRLLLLSLFLSVTCAANVLGQATPPVQPATGPGGAEGTYKVKMSTFGSASQFYWMFEPQGMRGSAPVIVFLHGWNATVPFGYRVWIDHIVSRGNIVIYPKFQRVYTEFPQDMTPNAMAAIKDAFARLGNRADRSKFAVVGHSLGAVVTWNVVAQATSAGLPTPRAVMSIEPGDTDVSVMKGLVPIVRKTELYNQIPSSILALVVVGDEDLLSKDIEGKRQFASIKQVPCANKNYIVVRSDRHGYPPLLANHFAPASVIVMQGRTRGGAGLFGRGRGPEPAENINTAPTGPVDALDYYGYWKLLDALTDAAFYNRNREYALGGGPQQTFMGNWSDGKPVTPLVVSNDPSCGR
jgi:dienelactone hydrolase